MQMLVSQRSVATGPSTLRSGDVFEIRSASLYGGTVFMIAARESIRRLTISLLYGYFLLPCLLAQRMPNSGKRPVEYANGLVGTAPLDDQKLIGNAPPPGEQLYSGFTSPAATLPHSSTELGPINANVDLNYPAGVRAPYFYPNRLIYGFTSGADGSPNIMP